MVFSGKRLRLPSGEVSAWTPLPEARDWPTFDRMIRNGDLIEVPDELLIRSLRTKKAGTRK
jgi:hypothetical protein